MKISKENNVILGNSFVSRWLGLRVRRWQKGWTNWKERRGLGYRHRTRVSLLLQECAGSCEQCWFWFSVPKWGWKHLLSRKYIAGLKSFRHNWSVSVAGCGAGAARLWLPRSLQAVSKEQDLVEVLLVFFVGRGNVERGWVEPWQRSNVCECNWGECS